MPRIYLCYNKCIHKKKVCCISCKDKCHYPCRYAKKERPGCGSYNEPAERPT